MKKNAALFTTGGIVYPMLEILCRGKTDVSMAFAGGICLCLINRVCNHDLKAMPITLKCFAGSAIITAVEFAIGVLVNLVLKQDVWDYSEMPLNVMGQVCLPFSILWFVLTPPAMGLCTLCERLQKSDGLQPARIPAAARARTKYGTVSVSEQPRSIPKGLGR